MNRIASRLRRGGRRLGAPDRQRLQPRQRHHHAGAAKKTAPGHFTRVSLQRAGRHLHGADSYGAGRRAFRQELSAGDDVLNEVAELVAAGREILAHLGEERLVRSQQTAAQGINQELAAQVIDELTLPSCAHERAQPLEPGPRAAVGERGAGFNRASRQIPIANLADRTVAFEDEAERVELRVAARARGIRAVLSERLAERQVAELGLVGRQHRDVRRRRGDVLAEQPVNDPVAALDRAGAQPGRVLGQEDRHRQQPAARVLLRVVDAGPRAPPPAPASRSAWPEPG